MFIDYVCHLYQWRIQKLRKGSPGFWREYSILHFNTVLLKSNLSRCKSRSFLHVFLVQCQSTHAPDPARLCLSPPWELFACAQKFTRLCGKANGDYIQNRGSPGSLHPPPPGSATTCMYGSCVKLM